MEWGRLRAVVSERALAGVLLLFVLFGLASGLLDVLLSRVLTGRPFAVLGTLVASASWEAVFLYILGHNMGLAAVVPGLGAALLPVAKPGERLFALRVLLAASVLALFSGLLLFPVPSSLPVFALFMAEAMGVALLAVPAYRALRRRIEKPSTTGLAPWALASFAVLAAAAFYETLLVAGIA